MCCDETGIGQPREVTMTRTQITLAGTGFEKYTKTTRRAQFLAEMDRVVPWRVLCERIEPVEEALYDSPTLRAFVGIDLGQEPVPDERPSASFAICWRRTGWAGRSSTKSPSICARK